MKVPSTFLAIAAFTAACGPSAGAPEPGFFAAQWLGADQGAGRLAANATWCARDSILEILAREGDRGIGLAVHMPTASPDTGRFVLVHPESDAVPRPGASAGWRFLAIDALHAFVSRNGELELTEVGDGTLSGRLTVLLVARSGPDTVSVQGTFHQVPIETAPTPCGLAPRTPVEVF